VFFGDFLRLDATGLFCPRDRGNIAVIFSREATAVAEGAGAAVQW